MDTTYELTTGIREEFDRVQTQMIYDFTKQFAGALLTSKTVGDGMVLAVVNANGNFDSLIFTVGFENGETKNYMISSAMSLGSLKFTDEALVALYDEFVSEQYKLKAQYNKAVEESQCRQKEAKKKADRIKKTEANYERLKEKSLKDFEELTQRAKQTITEPDEFYYALGWLAANARTVSAVLPDYLESAFVKYFGKDAPHRVVDSKKRSPAGWQQQWSWAFKISLKKPEAIPAMLNQYIGATGKEITKTSFIWDLVSDYGFRFGKKQDTLDIMRCVPIEYVPMFNEGLKA